MDPAVKMMTATLTKSTKKSGFGRIFLSGEERFFIPGKERFGKDEDSGYTGKNDLAKMRIRVILLGNGIRQ